MYKISRKPPLLKPPVTLPYTLSVHKCTGSVRVFWFVVQNVSVNDCKKGAKEGMKAGMFCILNNHAFNVLVTMTIGSMDSERAPLFNNEIPPLNISVKCKE
jgi:hypothetical protein